MSIFPGQLHIGARFSMPTASGPSPDVAPLRAWLDSGSLVSGLVAVVLVLAPAAHASLPDQSCIPGLYDNADFDDVVLLITSNLGAIQPSIVVSSRPVAAAVGLVAPTDIAPRRLFPPSSVLGRAPPLA